MVLYLKVIYTHVYMTYSQNGIFHEHVYTFYHYPFQLLNVYQFVSPKVMTRIYINPLTAKLLNWNFHALEVSEWKMFRLDKMEVTSF